MMIRSYYLMTIVARKEAVMIGFFLDTNKDRSFTNVFW